MCGIIGRINFESPVDKEVFMAMRDTLTHRGPDGAGLYVSDDGLTALGHRRLSFLDLTDKGAQPLSNENNTLFLTVNGEIYNYLALRKTLIEKGHIFKSNTDAEVILHGYEEWGVDVLKHLNGMFAFGLWDSTTKKLFLARDRFGIKPLYYHMGKNCFVFASEIKAIVKDKNIERQLNHAAMADYFVYRYIPSPYTIWHNIYKLPPAHYLTIENNSVKEVECYWELNTENIVLPEHEAIAHTDTLIKEAVSSHIQSEVPVGSFLSGGYDSSAMVYYLNKLNYPLNTFAIGFESWEKSEHFYAEIVAQKFNSKHKSLVINQNALDILDDLVYYYDEPIADISIVPTFMVSRLAAKDVKAVLSGEGADELFCGYTWHKEYYKILNDKSLAYRLKRLLNSTENIGVNTYSQAMAMGLFDKRELQNLICNEHHHHLKNDVFWFYNKHFRTDFSGLKHFQYLDIKTFMSELVLTKVDRASMANSLEVRVPFLDINLFSFVFNLNENVYYKHDDKKFLLRENIKNDMPQTILERNKQGFVGPDAYYQNIGFYKEVLMDSVLVKEGLINKSYLNSAFIKKDYWRLWKILVFELWYRKWL